MGINVSFIKRFQLYQRNKASPDQPLVTRQKFLIININRRGVFLFKDTIFPPTLEKFSSAGIFVGFFGIAGKILSQIQADDIIRVNLIKSLLFLRRNYIIRWRHNGRHARNDILIIPQSPKRFYNSHSKFMIFDLYIPCRSPVCLRQSPKS